MAHLSTKGPPLNGSKNPIFNCHFKLNFRSGVEIPKNLLSKHYPYVSKFKRN